MTTKNKNKKIPCWDLAIKIRFWRKKDAQKARDILITAINTQFDGIKKMMMLPAYDPDDVSLKPKGFSDDN